MLRMMESGTNTKCKNCNFMKKLPLLSSAALAALLFVGCSSDNTDDVTPAGEVKTYTELGAGLPSTRTTLDGASVVWSESDEISVWSDVTTTPVTFSLDSGAGTSNATFRVPQGAGVKGTASSIYKAVYPANANGNISIPQAQSWNDYANFSNNVNPMVAVGTDLSNMQFKNVCGIIVLQVETDEPGTVLNRIQLSTNSSQPLAGTGRLSFTGTDYSIQWESADYSVTLQCGQEISTTGMQQYYIVVPAGTYSDLTLSLLYKPGSNPAQTYTKTRNTSVTVGAGNITSVGANFSLQTKTYAVGDLYPNATEPEGVVYAVSDGGTSGYVVDLQDASAGTTWGPTSSDDIIAGLGNADGSLNMSAVLASGLIASYPAFNVCNELGDDWYLPSSTEMNTLVNAYSNITNALTTNGVRMSGTYWCSNVVGVDNYIYSCNVSMGSMTAIDPASQGSYKVRAIMQF